MPYDSKLDQKVFSETKDFEGTRITVGVFSYNNGDKKLQLSRENAGPDGEWRFAKLGRMTKGEAEEILPLIQTALKSM